MVFPKVCITSSINSGNPITSTTTLSPVHLMSLTNILVGIIVLILITPIHAHPLIPVGTSRHFEYKRYCSNSLSEAMRLICGGRSNFYNVQYQDSSATVNASNAKRFSNDDGVFFRTVQTGPIHECCRRPCGYSELKMYCAPV